MMSTALDQAAGLRRMYLAPGTRVLPVFGAPERVQVVVNLATALARMEQQVLALDASRGEIAPAFGLSARYELKHVLDRDISFQRATLHTRFGVQVLPAGRGMRLLAASGVSALDLFESLAQMAAPVDLILVNGEAEVRTARLLPSHGEALMVLPRGAEAVLEAAARMKALHAQYGFERFRVMMTRATYDDAQAAVDLLARSMFDHAGIEVEFGGNIPPDRRLWEAARARRTIFDVDPTGPVARAYQNAATAMTGWNLTVVTPVVSPEDAGAAAAHAAAFPAMFPAITKLH